MHDTLTTLLLVVVLFLVWPWPKPARNSLRLRRIEKKLDAVVKHLGLDVESEVDPKIVDLITAGKKIEAIKLYREQTGASLSDAKAYVESL
jgi:hypothetical protein